MYKIVILSNYFNKNNQLNVFKYIYIKFLIIFDYYLCWNLLILFQVITNMISNINTLKKRILPIVGLEHVLPVRITVNMGVMSMLRGLHSPKSSWTSCITGCSIQITPFYVGEILLLRRIYSRHIPHHTD